MVLPLQISSFFGKVKNKLKGHPPIVPAFFVRLKPFTKEISSWETLSESALIRIEKQVKSRSRKSGSFETDANEQFISALKKHGRALDLVLADENFGHLVTGKRFVEIDFPYFMPPNKEDFHRVCAFMEELVEPDLLEQFTKHILRGDFNQVLLWHRNCGFFSPRFKQKMEALLDSQLSRIEETLIAQPQSFQLNSNIPFAQNPEFYQLMNYYASRSLDLKIIKIVDWVDKHSTYSDSSSSIKNMLEAMVEYHTANASLHSYRVIVNALIRKEEKSVLVVILVGLSLFIAFVFFVFGSIKTKVPGPYAWPKEEMAAERVQREYQEVLNIPKKNLHGIRRLKSQTYLQQLQEMYGGGREAIQILEDSMSHWKTGMVLERQSPWCKPLPKTPEQTFRFINQTRQDLMLLCYFTQCYYPEFNGIFPCPRPVAYCITLVKSHDSLELSALLLDRFFIQTGPQFRAWKITVPLIDDELSLGYSFCDVRKQDSVLMTYEFTNMGESKSKGGRLVLREKSKTFSLCWESRHDAIFMQNKRAYLKTFKPYLIN